jgi:hypothetical protein
MSLAFLPQGIMEEWVVWTPFRWPWQPSCSCATNNEAGPLSHPDSSVEHGQSSTRSKVSLLLRVTLLQIRELSTVDLSAYQFLYSPVSGTCITVASSCNPWGCPRESLLILQNSRSLAIRTWIWYLMLYWHLAHTFAKSHLQIRNVPGSTFVCSLDPGVSLSLLNA